MVYSLLLTVLIFLFILLWFSFFIREIDRQIAANARRGKCWLLKYRGKGLMVCRQAWLTCLNLTSYAVDNIKSALKSGSLFLAFIVSWFDV
jgi:hypothetical protein